MLREMGRFKPFLFLAIVLIVLTILPKPAICCDGTSSKIGNMSMDMDVEVGSPFTVTCTLFSHRININGTDYRITSEDLAFKFGNKTFQDVDIIDDFSIEYTIFNATVNDTGFYSCIMSSPSIHFNPLICSSYVAVGYKPLRINDMSCVSYNYERLNCSWKEPYNPVKTSYKLYDNRYLMRPCAAYYGSSCEWRLDSEPPYRKQPLSIELVLEGKNSLGYEKQYISLLHWKIIKPAAPQNIKDMREPFINQTSLQLQWLPPKGMEFDDIKNHLEYWIYYCRADGLFPELCGVVNTNAVTSTEIHGLIPSTTYKIMLRCKTNVNGSYWSEFLNKTVTTKSDVPYLAPETMGSLFEIQNTQSSRRITLYWKPIPRQFENGNSFGYVIKYHMHYVRHRSKRGTHERIIEVGNNTTHSFENMDLNVAYLFRIYAKNSVAVSSNFSVIVVDKADNMPPVPEDILVLALGNGNYNISWKPVIPTSNINTGNYTLFFCQNIWQRPFNCEGPIEWKTVHGTHHQVTLPHHNMNYQFGVAYNAHHATSGIKWAFCVVPFHGVLHKVQNVVVTRHSPTGMQIYWNLECGAQKDVVKRYTISYCPVHADMSCSVKMQQINVTNPDSEQYIVENLKPYTWYKFIVTACNANGCSEKSDVKHERTMTAAPDDPPQDPSLLTVNETSVLMSFKPPTQPNGEIDKYVISYAPAGSPISEMKRIDYRPFVKSRNIYVVELKQKDIAHYTNYSILLQACVGLACSNYSKPLYVFTGIGSPGFMDQPHAEVINTTLVNITWKPPSMPNGPIDMYELTMTYTETFDEMERQEIVITNVTGTETSMTVNVDCQPMGSEGVSYNFGIRAVNVRNGVLLFSPPSEVTKAKLCFISPIGMSTIVLIGVIIGVACGLSLLILLIFSLAKWMKKEVDTLKRIQVQLPRGLDSPIENPLNNTYDKFKNGLQMNRDAGIPTESAYKRLCSYSSSDKLSKHLESSYDASSEEFLSTKGNREKNGRNRSGDSSVSCKGHDSISSSNTNKTHISIDSGAEVDLPPSPDGIFSETSSSNTTPRSYKPDLEMVEENCPSNNSKDSGLERESMSPRPVTKVMRITDMSPKCPYYIRKKDPIYFNPHLLKKNGHMQPYSKFAIVAPAFTSSYVSVGVHNVNLLDQQSLANSEPSVAEFPDDSDSEPLMLSGVPPYCRFGLARSVGNGLNITNQAFPVQQNLGYSKFGIIYSAVRKPNSIESEVFSAPSYSKVTQPKMMQNLVGNTVDLFCRPAPGLGQKSMRQKTLDVVEEKPDNVSCSDVELIDTSEISTEATEIGGSGSSSLPCAISCAPKTGVNSGYVTYNHALSGFNGNEENCKNSGQFGGVESDAESVNDDICQTSTDMSEDYVPNDVLNALNNEEKVLDPILDHSSLGTMHQEMPVQPKKKSSYVSFQDAKVMARHGQSDCNSLPNTLNGNHIEMPAIGISENVDEDTIPFKYKTNSLDSSPAVVSCSTDNHETVSKTDSTQFSNDSEDNNMGCLSPENSVKLVDLISDLPSPSRTAEIEQVILQNSSPPSLNSPDVRSNSNVKECSKFSDIHESVSMPKPLDRTFCGQNSKKLQHGSTNGYVTWNELIGDRKPQTATDIVTVPCVTNDKPVEIV